MAIRPLPPSSDAPPATSSAIPSADAPGRGAPADPRAPRRLSGAELTFWLFAAILLALTWVAVTLKAREEREHAVNATIRANGNLARAFEEHTVRTLASVDQTVLFLKYQFERIGRQLDIPGYVRDGAIVATLFNQIGVIDEHGRYILSSLPDHRPIDLSDRRHFRVHAESDQVGLFVSEPVLGRASGKWSVQLTRRLNHPDGRFAGIVVASIDPFYFTTLYREVDLGERGVVALIGDDGIIRARRSGQEVSTGQDVSGTPLFGTFADQESGSYRQPSSIDGVRRIISFRRLPGYPLTVLVGSDEDEALAEVRERVRGYVAFAALASAVIVLFATVATLMLRRQRAISARLEASQARAQEANRLKSEFLASMSHELRTPLNGIIGYAEYLHDAAPDGTEREFAGVILKSGNHLLDLVNTLLDLSKVEAGQLELDPTDVPLRELVEQAASAQRPLADAKGLELRTTVAPDVPPTWRCDRTRVLQVLNNLVNNAVKFTDRGRVTLEVRRSPEGLRFSVTDTGTGIPDAFLPDLFEKFRQADTFVTRRHGGTGLGLALSRELAEMMGGSIGVRSAVGAGTTFTLDLPEAVG